MSKTMGRPRASFGRNGTRLHRRTVVIASCGVAVIALMGISTDFVRIGANGDGEPAGFVPDAFGAKTFPRIQAAVVAKAVDAVAFANALAADRARASARYGVPGSVGPEISIRFSGTAGNAISGIYPVAIPNLPPDIHVRIQTGPAINGTDIRDATGTISFGQFTNQIDYQNAGSALNRAMKHDVLSKIDTSRLAGKTVSVTGVFQLINPHNWLVTPVEMSVP